MQIKFIFLSILAAFALAACDKNDSSSTSASTTTPAETAAPAAQQDAAPADAAPAAAGSTGVPECDVYFDKMLACFQDKFPAEQRQAMIDDFNQSKAAIAEVGGKAAMAEACKQGMDAAKEAMSAYGCSF